MTQAKDFKNVDYHSLVATGKVKQALRRFTSMLGESKSLTAENSESENNNGNQIDGEKDNEDSASSFSSASSAPFVKARRRTQVLALFPIYLLQVCYGMNTGFPAILTPQLQETCLITSLQAAWIVSLDNFATPIVCILSGFFQQKFGPKKVLLLASVPYILAWILAAAANTDDNTNIVAFLYTSRVLVGVSHALITTTVYTVEVASKDMRGTYSLWESVLRCLGCLIVYSLGFAIRWHQIALFSWVVPLLAAICCFCIPESPVFLLSRGKDIKAERAMRGLYGPRYRVSEEADIIRDNLAELREKRRDSPVWSNVRSHPEIYKPFFIVLLLGVIQQFSGMSILRAYVVTIFDEVFHPSGFNSTSEQINTNLTISDCDNEMTSKEGYLSAILLALVRLASSLLLSKLLTKYNRRSMYMCSIVSTVLSLIGFATCVLLIDRGLFATAMKWTSLAMACMLVFAVQLGVQTLPNLLSGELFSADVRALCKGMTRSFTCVFLVTGLMMFPLLVDAVHLFGAFYLFSIAMAAFVPLVYCILPETKDLGLEMVQQFFVPARTVFYVDLDSYESCDRKVTKE